MVVAVALLVFGPKRIPEIAGSIGKGIREFRKSIVGTGSDDLPGPPDPPPPRGAAPGDGATVSAGGDEPKRLLN
jgi:sec-independent protein translocase protein TatA